VQKTLAVDCLPQAVVVLDEGGDEFMQAGLKNSFVVRFMDDIPPILQIACVTQWRMTKLIAPTIAPIIMSHRMIFSPVRGVISKTTAAKHAIATGVTTMTKIIASSLVID
jgi:hypothetical protein